MHILKRLIVIGVMFLPLVATAQGAHVCTPPEHELKRGDSGNDVANLQIFLGRQAAIYPERIVSGFYGPATERAVRRWQLKYGVISALTEQGGGRVGARTVSFLKKVWECDTRLSVGWFSATVSGGSTLFSAQASSTYPINPSLLYIEFGDGKRGTISVSNAICRTFAGGCSSLISAAHLYPSGHFTALLKVVHPTEHCALYSPAWICAQAATSKVLATTTIASNGIAATSSTSTRGGAAQSRTSSTPYISRVRAPAARPASVSGTVVLSGGGLSISWITADAPLGASADILLSDDSGNALGTIARDAGVSGSYWWTIPRRSNDTCAANALTCLAQVAGVPCEGGVCPLGNGTYGVSIRIRYSGSTIGSAQIGTFTIGDGNIAVTASSSPPASSTAATSSSSLYGSYDAVPTSHAVLPKSCAYSGVQYGDGITLSVSCADVAGGTCSGYGGQSLTCKNGSWVNASGTPVLIPNVTMPSRSSGSSCKTPWGGQIVDSGNQITYEPFFTTATSSIYGNYTGAAVLPLMQCTNGQWQKCDWQGANCRAYTPAS